MKRTAYASAFVLASSLVAGCGGDDGTPTPPACDVPGEGCTWLGKTAEVGFTKDGKTRLETTIYWSMDTLFASDGTTWFIDWNNHLVRRVMTDGTIKSMIGWNDPVFPGDLRRQIHGVLLAEATEVERHAGLRQENFSRRPLHFPPSNQPPCRLHLGIGRQPRVFRPVVPEPD